MRDEARHPTRAKGPSRLIYGVRGGVRHGPRRIALEIAAARAIDMALGRSGLVRPVLLVSGFWRSGTTWLQEAAAAALGAKTVFEPLSPMEPLRRAMLARLHPGDGEDVVEATIPGPEGEPFWSLLAAAARGKLSTPYLLSCRSGVAESWRRRIVLKDVRLQSNLARFHERFGCPVVHIRRHPCAVVASFRAAGWHWGFDGAPLAVLLPRLGAALPEGVATAALRFDTDALSRIAALWAVTERIAAAQLDGTGWGLVLRYEVFAAEPERSLAATLKRIGLEPSGTVDFSAPSATVDPNVFAASASPPSDRWRRAMRAEEISRIEQVADALYPEWRTGAAG